MSEVASGNPPYPKPLHPQASALKASLPYLSIQWSDGSGGDGRGVLVQTNLSSASRIQVGAGGRWGVRGALQEGAVESPSRGAGLLPDAPALMSPS